MADILRYYHVEKWRVGTMAKQLGVHHATIKRVLSSHGIPKSDFLTKGSMIDPYLPFIMATLEKFPKVTASRLYAMVQARGYPGGENHFRHLISLYRPKPAAEAYLRLKTLPAEQAQVDCGHERIIGQLNQLATLLFKDLFHTKRFVFRAWAMCSRTLTPQRRLHI